MFKFSNKIGLGTMMFGWKIPLIEAKKIINYCIKNKIMFFDTSPSYGNGMSEIITGESLKTFKRNQFKISTKFSLRNKKKIYASIYETMNLSLKRLQVNYIDYFVLHHSVSFKKLVKIIEAAKLLKKRKKIKKFILSNPSKYLTRQISKNLLILRQIDGFQFKHNILFQNFDIFKILHLKKIELITYSPLAEGILTGKYLKKTKNGRIFEATKKKEYYRSLISKKNKKKLIKIYKANNSSVNNLINQSYNFLLSDQRISQILIGVSSLNQLHKNIGIIKKIGK